MTSFIFLKFYFSIVNHDGYKLDVAQLFTVYSEELFSRLHDGYKLKVALVCHILYMTVINKIMKLHNL